MRGYECDSLGHVNNAVYLQYLKQAKLEARRIADLAEAGLDIRKLTIEYQTPACYGDELEVAVWVLAVGVSGATCAYEITRRVDGASVVRAPIDFAGARGLERLLEPNATRPLLKPFVVPRAIVARPFRWRHRVRQFRVHHVIANKQMRGRLVFLQVVQFPRPPNRLDPWRVELAASRWSPSLLRAPHEGLRAIASPRHRRYNQSRSLMRYPRRLLYLACLTFWLVSLLNLNRFPVIHQNEPWILSPRYKLFTQGIYGSDFFSGFYGMDRHYLQFMPLMSVLEGTATRAAGVGFFQPRFVTVALGLVMLALVYRVGRQLASPQVGALGVLLLLTWQWTDGGGRALGTGIPLVDLARIARYDLLAAVLGVAGFSVYLAARRKGNLSLYFGTGLLIGLAGLAHLYGLLWLAPLALLELTARGRLSRLVAVGAGTLVAWLPWLLFLASNWSDYVGQVSPDRTRYSVFDPSFYVSNLLAEPQRYHFDLQLAGTWLLLAGLPLAWLWLLVDSVRHKKQHGFALAIVALGLPLLLALLLVQKTFNYLLTIVPIAALMLSVGVARLLASRFLLLQAGVALLLLGNAGQGVFAILQMQQRAPHKEPPEVELAQLRALIPAAARVLGHPQYALAFDLADYRSFLLAFDFSDPEANREPFSLYAALERIAPDYILYDPAIDGVFSDQSTALHEAWRSGFQRFLQAHHACVVSTVYGQERNAVRIYQLNLQVPTSRLSHLLPSLP